ncbi:zeta toxin family protein [Streptomyces sp. NPDC020858]|uniref:zeta toxin family protein n=1 Tax=Streptomyces sp. NPDC020858 TaxID=3365097 RepID=UPI0037BAEF71
MDVLREEYRAVYRNLQDRFATGDLATGPADTYGQHRHDGAWSVERLRLHRAILDEAKAACAGLPRGGQAVLLTSGPPGAGKGTSLGMLRARQGDGTELGQALARVHGADVNDYVVLDADAFKEAIIRHGGAPSLPPRARELPGGLRLAPAELAPLVHRESSFLQDTFESWARTQGFNLLYDGVMGNFDWTARMLGDLAQEGYGDRVVLSIEVPIQTSLEQNALRWQNGRTAFDQGTDAYGGRMAPEHLIRALYPDQSGYSLSRANAHRLYADGKVTGIIELDRGAWAKEPARGPQAPAMQHRSTEADAMRVGTATRRPSSAAARSKSTTVRGRTAPKSGPAAPPAQGGLRPAPPERRPGRSL